MIQVNDSLLAYADKYYNTFRCQLPLRMFPQTLTNDELFKLIDDCIARNCNDIVEQFVNVEEDILL